MRGKTFITPKTEKMLHLHLDNPEINRKLIKLGKILNVNLSLLTTQIISEVIDKKLLESERTAYEMLNEEAKVDMIIDLKRQLEIAHRISGGREDA